MRTGNLVLPNGLRLNYAEQGPDGGVPLLMLHGVTDSWRSFETVMPHLPGGMRAIAISQRGHGDSSRPADGYRLEQLAADVASFMDALGLPAAVLLGHSMGGSVALRFAIRYPGRTLGLVLAGARAAWRGHPDIVEMWNSDLGALQDPVDPGFVRAFQESTVAQTIAPDFLDMVIGESLKLPARVWQAAFRDAVLGADDTASLGQVSAPTLLLCGDRDGLAWDGQDTLAAGIAGARRVTHRRAGHALHWEEPARFAGAVAAFAMEAASSRLAPVSP